MKIAVIGLGYVGLPLAMVFAEAGVQVVGVEAVAARCDEVNAGRSYIQDVPGEALAAMVDKGLILATTDHVATEDCDAVIICLPTPLNANREPDLTLVKDATAKLAGHLRRGQLVTLESTTYPGTTRDELAPILEAGSGLTAGVDFHLAFSPERVDPGRTDYTTKSTPKVVGGLTPACTARALEVYGPALDNVVPVSTPEVAEMTKLLEQTGPAQVKQNLNRPTHASVVMHQLAEMYPKRSLVVLFTDMLDDSDPEELFSALRHFRYNKHEVILFHVKDHRLEEAFDFQNRPHRFVDMETGRSIRVNPAEIRTQYREKISKYFADIKLRCGQFDIDFVEADIREDFREVLLPLLIKRQKLF